MVRKTRESSELSEDQLSNGKRLIQSFEFEDLESEPSLVFQSFDLTNFTKPASADNRADLIVFELSWTTRHRRLRL
jgi:hypothetical protein